MEYLPLGRLNTLLETVIGIARDRAPDVDDILMGSEELGDSHCGFN